MDNQIRQTAIKTRISNLINGSYVLKGGLEPNYILYNGQKISRVNLIGVVVSKNQSEFSNNTSLIIDDGSGRIGVRSFDNEPILDRVSVGEVVLLIGKPREYGNEIYIVPEVIKEVENKGWVEVRKLELGLSDGHGGAQQKIDQKADSQTSEEEVVEEDDGPVNTTSAESLLKIIKNIDDGEGADFQDVVAMAKSENAEDILKNLIKNGDIFELRPGKLKVLE